MSVNQSLGQVPKKELTGIGGWLILVAIGQVLAPLIQLYLGLAYFLTPDFTSLWKTYPVTALGEVIMNVGMFLFMIWCSYNFFKKSHRFPTLFIWELWLVVGLQVIDAAWVAAMVHVSINKLFDTSDTIQIAKATVTALIWTAYTLKSRRVKNTFGLMAKPWNMRRSAMWGALFGALFVVGKALVAQGSLDMSASEWGHFTARVLFGAIGGGILLVFVSVVRNAIVRAK